MKKQKGGADGVRDGGESGDDDCVYLKAEDAAMRAAADLQFEFPMPHREAAGGLASFGLVMVVSTRAADQIVRGTRELVGDAAVENQMALD
jgi:hypothetical protein